MFVRKTLLITRSLDQVRSANTPPCQGVLGLEAETLGTIEEHIPSHRFGEYIRDHPFSGEVLDVHNILLRQIVREFNLDIDVLCSGIWEVDLE